MVMYELRNIFCFLRIQIKLQCVRYLSLKLKIVTQRHDMQNLKNFVQYPLFRKDTVRSYNNLSPNNCQHEFLFTHLLDVRCIPSVLIMALTVRVALQPFSTLSTATAFATLLREMLYCWRGAISNDSGHQEGVFYMNGQFLKYKPYSSSL